MLAMGDDDTVLMDEEEKLCDRRRMFARPPVAELQES